MRPLALAFEGFTCFRTEQHLDFSKLHLFAISGPTGSGKSTLLDAITYALYGRVYRIDGVAELISQGSEKLWVTFDFQVGGRCFRVYRSLRRKTKAGDTQLDEITGDEEKLLGSGTREVNPQIESHVGLSYAAFVQSVVLPQGAFARFLKSPAADRRKLLVELFSLEQYETMRKRANERAKQQEDRILSLVERLQQDYAAATAEGIAQQEANATKARDLAASLSTQLSKLSAAAQRAKELNRLTRDLAQKHKQREDLRRAGVDCKQDERRLDRAQRAAPVVGPRALLKEASEQLSVAKRVSKEATDEHVEVGRALERAEKRLAAAQKAGAQLPELNKRIGSLEKALAQLRHLQAMRSRVNRLEDERDGLRETLFAARDAAKRLEGGERELGRQKSAADKELAAVEHDSVVLRRLVAAAKSAKAVRELRAESRNLERTAVKAEEAAGDAASARDKASAEARRLFDVLQKAAADAEEAVENHEALKRQHSALELRAHLKNGDACPVCEQRVASVPARQRAPGLAESERRRQSVEKKRQEAQSRSDGAQTSLGHCVQQLEEAQVLANYTRGESKKAAAALKRQEESLMRETKGLVEKSEVIEDAVDAAREEEERRKERHDELEKAAHRAAQDLALTAVKLKSANDRVEELARRVEATDTELADATAEAKKLQGEVRELAGTKGDPSLEVKEEFIAKKEQLEEELEEATATHRDAEKASVKIAAQAKAAAQLLKEAVERQERASVTADTAAKKAGFETVEEAATAELDEKTRKQLEERVQAWRQQVAEVEGRIAELEQELGRDRVGDEALAQALARERETAAKVKDAEREADRLDHQVKLLSAQLAKAKELRGQLRELELSSGVWKALGHALKSDGFQDWVLENTVRGLMTAATARLQQLSGGRYALQRRADDGRIDVLDYENAHEARSAETLSGGETFLASLALALALSERVQAAGGVMLDSLFIDEGFGSLDPQSLNTAIDAIESLQTGGRMVGVISHVDTLRERLRQRVLVEKVAEGSLVKVEA